LFLVYGWWVYAVVFNPWQVHLRIKLAYAPWTKLKVALP
jgi:hypothetical protein